MQKYKITRVHVSDTKKDTGQKYVDKTGRPFSRVGIQTEQTGDTWYSTLSYRETDRERSLKEGDVVELILETNGDFKNFKLPSKLDQLEVRVAELERRLNGEPAKQTAEPLTTEWPPEEPSQEIVPDDIPF